jgi:elongation factor G
MIKDLSKVRNIGISAHIDSGKTTLTERILFTRTVSTPSTRSRARTASAPRWTPWSWSASAASPSSRPPPTRCGKAPRQHHRHPGARRLHHRGRALAAGARRRDPGALLGGRRPEPVHHRRAVRWRATTFPRIAFVNKCDRTGANPVRVTSQLRTSSTSTPMMQLPIGLEDEHEGVIDLVTMKAIYFEGPHGETSVRRRSRRSWRMRRRQYREELLDAVSMFSDELTEAILEETVTPELMIHAGPQGRAELQFCPRLRGLGLQEQGRAAPARRGHPLPARPTDVENHAP